MNESRAARHQRHRRRGRAAGALSVLGGLALLSFTPLGRVFADWSAAAARGLDGLPQVVVSLGVFSLLVVAVLALAAWPAALYARRPPVRAPGADDEADASEIDRLVLAHLQWALVALPLAFGAGALVQGAVWLTGAWWWLVAGAFAGAVLAGALHGASGVIARWSGARPLDRPALVERLGALARRVKVPIASIDELPRGAGVTASALVSGAGGSRRVFLAAEVVRDWREDEIAVVVAHELAHHAHHDLWRTLAIDAATLAIGLLAGEILLGALAGAPAGTLESLPAVALAAALVWLLATPLRLAESRRQERRADRFALELTGHAEAFATAIRRLGARHLAEERPTALTRWFYHRHPPVAERLALAEAYREVSAAE